MVTVDTTIWQLELAGSEALRATAAPGEHVTVARAELPYGALNRFFYLTVGEPHHWVDRRDWSGERWQEYVQQPGLETWLVCERGTPAGYAEIRHTARNGTIEFFGLLPGFQGRGLGGYLLTVAARRLFALGAARVAVETCELDGPHARANYEARGFAVASERREPRRLLPVSGG